MTSDLFLSLPSLLTGSLRKSWKAMAIFCSFLEAFSTPWCIWLFLGDFAVTTWCKALTVQPPLDQSCWPQPSALLSTSYILESFGLASSLCLDLDWAPLSTQIYSYLVGWFCIPCSCLRLEFLHWSHPTPTPNVRTPTSALRDSGTLHLLINVCGLNPIGW